MIRLNVVREFPSSSVAFFPCHTVKILAKMGVSVAKTEAVYRNPGGSKYVSPEIEVDLL